MNANDAHHPPAPLSRDSGLAPNELAPLIGQLQIMDQRIAELEARLSSVESESSPDHARLRRPRGHRQLHHEKGWQPTRR